MAEIAKQRQCPAVGRPILPRECGENRLSRYACPADCARNPFLESLSALILVLKVAADAIDKALRA